MEIDLGNGLFGYRKTGTITVAANTRANTAIVSGLTAIVSCGGWWDVGNGGLCNVVGATPNTSGLNSFYHEANTFIGSGTFYHSSMSNTARSSSPYDIWVLYTK